MQQNAVHMEVLRLLMEENVDASSFNYSFIVGILICAENIKALYRYYVYNVGVYDSVYWRSVVIGWYRYYIG